MENLVKSRWARRLLLSTAIALVLVLCVSFVALAVPSSVTDFTAMATDTTIMLRWTKAAGSTNTTIKYSTTTYPATPAAGTSAYGGTGYYTTVSPLVVGTTYYFSAWGYDGASYSATAANLVITTMPASITATIPISTPVLPTEVLQTPSTSGWSIAPLDWIVGHFSTSGLGMPANNLWMLLAALGITGIGILVYVKWRNFAAAYFVVFVASIFATSAGVMQGVVIGYEILVGMGVWAVERYYQ